MHLHGKRLQALLYFDLQPLREKITKTIASFLARSRNFSCKNYSTLCKKVCNSLLQKKLSLQAPIFAPRKKTNSKLVANGNSRL